MYQHLEKLHEFWSTLDEIDNSLRVVNVERPSRSQSSRKIELGKSITGHVSWMIVLLSHFVLSAF